MKRSQPSVIAGLSLAWGPLGLGCTTMGNGDDDGGSVDPSQLDPLDADCEALTPVDLGATVTSVSTEDELRTALADGGSIQLTANIQASAPFPVDVDALVDGGGFTIDGGGATHLFVVDNVRFTIQRITLRNAFNNLPDDQHFSWRSGAAIMARGFVADDQPGTGALTVIDVTFDDNRTKATGPGDIRGGAIYGFTMPEITISGSTFLNNVGSNGGAIGGLGSSFSIIDSVFVANETNGPGGSGALEGHGGAISLDAVSQNLVTAYLNVCGSSFSDNVARTSTTRPFNKAAACGSGRAGARWCSRT